MATVQSGELMYHFRKAAGITNDASADRELLRQFIHTQDENAFEALLHRYGPMVRGVCLRVLQNSEDADDAFQATFLVLARKATTIYRQHAVGAWLFGVAQRISQNMRAGAARRREHELAAATQQPVQSTDDLSVGEMRRILDEELAALPEKYRAPILLCCLDGKSRDEAAEELGWSLGSVKGRLERGREMLRRRLANRGLVLSTVFLVVMTHKGVKAAVPIGLVATTLKAALAVALGRPLTELVSVQVRTLIQAFAKTSVGKAKTLLLFLTLVLGLGTLGGLAGSPRGNVAKTITNSDSTAAMIPPSKTSEPVASRKVIPPLSTSKPKPSSPKNSVDDQQARPKKVSKAPPRARSRVSSFSFADQSRSFSFRIEETNGKRRKTNIRRGRPSPEKKNSAK